MILLSLSLKYYVTSSGVRGKYYPQNCDGCGGNHFLPRAKVAEARQVIEIPPIRPIVTEHQAMKCRCANCGKQVRANPPRDVTSSAFVPKIKAWCTVLAGKFHLSKNQIKLLIWIGYKMLNYAVELMLD